MRTRSRIAMTVVACAAMIFTGISAATGAPPLPGATNPHIIAHFDFAMGQTAEDLAVGPGGTVDVSMASANNVVRVARDGTITTVLAQFPTTGKCSILRGASTLGIALAPGGTLYVVECSGDANQGIWRISPGLPPVQLAQLPPDGFPNGLALDDAAGDLYVTDSALGEVWKVPVDGGPATVWASGPAFQRKNLVGALGIAVHRGAVWVGNSDAGTILRIPIEPDGTAGPVDTVVSGLASFTGKFDVVGPEDTIVVPMVVANEVVLVQPGGQPQVVLTAADGLSTPTSAAVRGGEMYVTSGAYLTLTDPNLLVADFHR